MRPLYACLLFWVCLLPVRPARAQLTPQLTQALQQELDRTRLQYGAHGLSAAVLLPDQSVWTGVSGVSTATDSLGPTHLLGVGSITKTFTAALVLQLVEQGRVGLDDSIGHYVPAVFDYPNIDPGVTVRQLLNHTGGVYNYTNNPSFASQTNLLPNRLFQPTDMLGMAGPMQFTPGTNWEYSNTDYVLLGMLLEAQGGQPVGRLYRQRLITPLGLTSTWMGYADTIPAGQPVAHGWIQTAVGGPYSADLSLRSRNAMFSGAYAAGALLSTPTDLVRWARALYGTTAVLSAATRDTMLTLAPLSTSAYYGLGVMRTNRSGRIMWGHNGSIPGYMATFGYVPTCGMAVAVMINESRAITEVTTSRLFAILNNQVCRVQGVRPEALLPAPALWPNPATTATTLAYSCPPGTRTLTLAVYDALGAQVRTLPLSPSATEAPLALAALPAGTYMCRLWADGHPGPVTRLLVP